MKDARQTFVARFSTNMSSVSNEGTFMGVNSVHYFCCQNELCHFARISNIMCVYLLANIMSYVYANNLRINAFPLSRLPTRRQNKSTMWYLHWFPPVPRHVSLGIRRFGLKRISSRYKVVCGCALLI